MKKKSLLIIATSLLLIGCNNSPATPTSSSSDPSTPSQASVESEMFTTSISNEKSSGISISDFLIDASVGLNMVVGNQYRISFSFSDGSSNENPVVESSREDIISVLETKTGYFLQANCAGDSVITIKDNTGFTHYRKVLHARNAMDVDEIQDYLFEVDHWQGYQYAQDNKVITFLGKGNAILSGVDFGTQLSPIQFTFVHEAYNYNGTSYSDNADEYFFRIPDFVNQSGTLSVVGFFVGLTGDAIHLMTPNGVDNIYFPVMA